MAKLSEIQSDRFALESKIKELAARPKTYIQGETCVRFYDQVLSKQECTSIINLFEDSKKIDSFNTGHKEFTELDIDNLPVQDKNKWTDIREKFIYIMREHMDKFMQDVKIEKHHFPPIIDMENIRIKKYTSNEKDQFANHVDVVRSSGPSSKRFLVFILYLSDVEEGGETYIPRFDIKCKPKAGRLLIFPPFWTHPHSGEKVIKGTKYTIMSYLHYGDTIGRIQEG